MVSLLEAKSTAPTICTIGKCGDAFGPATLKKGVLVCLCSRRLYHKVFFTDGGWQMSTRETPSNAVRVFTDPMDGVVLSDLPHTVDKDRPIAF